MGNYVKRTLPDHFAVLAGPQPPDAECFQTSYFQVLWAESDQSFADDGPHAHRESDEIYIVLQGEMTLDIDGETVIVRAGEICCVPAGVFHWVTGMSAPRRHLVVRAPSVSDKVYPEESGG